MPYIGQRPATGEANSFKILDDISNYTLTFGSSDIDVSADTITAREHRFVTGQRVTYGNGGGTDPTGLSNGTVYYIIVEDRHSFKLATSASNAVAGTAINITAAGAGAAHTINVAFDGVNTKFKATHTNGTKADITQSGQLMVSVNGVLQQPHDNTTTPTTGYATDHTSTIIFSAAPATGDQFFGRLIASNFATFDISDNTVDNFTGDGNTSTFTLSKTPPNNESVLVTIDGVVQYPDDNSAVRAYTVSENVIDFASAPGNAVEIQVRHIGFAGASTGGISGFYGRTGNAVLKNTDDIVFRNANVGVVTATDIRVTGNLTVDGTTTTLDTDLIGVDKLEVSANNTTSAGIITQTGSGDILQLYDGSTQAVTVADGGNVGINTTAPAEKLDVWGTIRASEGTSQYMHMYPVAGAGYFDVSNSTTYPSIVFRQIGSGGTQERLRITSDGKIGIGTVSPTDKLSVYGGTASVWNTNTNNRVWNAGTTNGHGLMKVFRSDGKVFFRVDSSARKVGIGTDNPTALIHAQNNSVTDTKIIIESTGTNSYPTFRVKNDARTYDLGIDGATDAFRVYDVTGTAERLRITSTGAINCGHGDAINLHGSTTTGINLNGNNNSGQIIANVSNNRALIIGRQANYGQVIEFFQGTNINQAAITIPAADSFGIETAGTERLRIASDGVITGRGELRLTEGTSSVSNGDEIGSLMFTYPSNDNKNAKIVALKNAGTSGADLAFFTRTHGDGTNNDGGEERLRITSNGSVGIGTDNPTETLTLNHANGASIGLEYSGTENGTINVNSAAMYARAGTGKHLILGSDGEEKLRIASSGAVGIGTNSPDDKLHVLGGNIQVGKTEETGYETIIGNNVLRFNRTAASYIDQAGTGDIRFRYGASNNTWMHMEGSNGRIGIGIDNPTSDLHVFRSTAASSIIDAAAGDALLTLRNAGNTNWSGINFTRERNTGDNVTGGSIWMPSDTSNNSATLYLQTQTASANAGVAGALTDNNGVRLKLASQPGGNGGNSAFTVEVGSAERLRVTSSGKLHLGYDASSNAGTDQVNIVAAGSGINICRVQSGSPSQNEWLGALGFKGYASGNSSSGADARIHAQASASHSGTSAPADLIFSTKPDTTGPGSSPTERLRIRSNGEIASANLSINAYANQNTPGGYSQFQSDNHANTFFGQNLKLGASAGSGNHQIEIINQHATIGGAGMYIGGNGNSSRANAVSFYAVPANQGPGTNVTNQDRLRIAESNTYFWTQPTNYYNSGHNYLRTFGFTFNLQDGETETLFYNPDGYRRIWYEIYVQSGHGSNGYGYILANISRYGMQVHDVDWHVSYTSYAFSGSVNGTVTHNGIKFTRSGWSNTNITYYVIVKCFSPGGGNPFSVSGLTDPAYRYYSQGF